MVCVYRKTNYKWCVYKLLVLLCWGNEPSKRRSFRIKTRVLWVSGIYRFLEISVLIARFLFTINSSKSNFVSPTYRTVQGGPLLVINGVITYTINGLINGQKGYFTLLTWAPCHSTYSWFLGPPAVEMRVFGHRIPRFFGPISPSQEPMSTWKIPLK